MKEINDILEEAKNKLEEDFKGEILSIVLFGSLARGAKKIGDIDLLIITKRRLGSSYKVTKLFAKQVFGNLFGKYNILFSPIIYDYETFKNLKDNSLLFENIRREGRLIYGKNFL
ncbi:nucleotidyltransferase domain-containing protein [bacterium]|nr:nucleotidyltransferase domain-containing protein [bacterium]MBU0899905.1 nucleotidyltransferase domain-containing protein [bacterium]MBU1153191.1 nucleotidyltransferase domain-containing protein [bacterium]MBU2599932.1 nucleotidyltransferase domain-containing protein [bacterium]